jgi:sensor domain CHASE-containing protein
MNSLPGIITAISAVILALTGLVAAVKGLIPLLHEQQKTTAAVAQVHELVNSRSDHQDARIDQLTRTLTGAGVAVPAAKPGPPDSPAQKYLAP